MTPSELKAKIESLKMEKRDIDYLARRYYMEDVRGNFTVGYNQAVDEFNARIDKLLEEL